MTAKRFETNMRLVIDTEKKYGASVLNAEEVVDLLNEQHEIIKQLKKSIKRQQGSNDECAKLIKEQQKENEQLKQQLQSILKLTKEIEDCTHDIKMIGDLE